MNSLASFSRVTPVLVAIGLAAQFNGGAGYQTYMLSCLLVLGAFSFTLLTTSKPVITFGIDNPLLWFTLFVAWTTLSLLWSQSVGPSVLSQPRLYAGMLFGLTAYLISTKDFRVSLVALQLLALALSLYTAYQGLELEIPRPSAFFVNWNTHAAFLNLILLPTAAFYLKGKNRLLLGFLLSIIAFASAMTLSRGAILGGATGLFCLIILVRNKVERSSVIQLFLWILSGYILGSLLHEGMPLARLTSSLANENIASGRGIIWGSSWEMYKQFPFLGWGIETFWQAYPAFRHPQDGSAGQNAHNEYLQFLVELGPIGLLLFIALLLTLAIRAYNYRKNIGFEGAGLIGALVSLGLQAVFTTTYYQLAIWLVFGWYVGRLSVLTEDKTRPDLKFGQHFTRKGFTALVILISAIPGVWLTALLMSEVELTKLENMSTAGQFLRQLPRVEKYYSFRDVTQLLFAAQINSALVEKRGEITQAEKVQAINTALTRLKQAEQLYPMRANNFLLRAELKQHATERYPTSEVINDYQKALELDPYMLMARMEFAQYLEEAGYNKNALQILQDGWNRQYYVHFQIIETYINTLKDAQNRAADTQSLEEIREVEERVNKLREKGYIVFHVYLGKNRS